jgi:RNA polymerase sigma-70 factor, ECF subfamily
MTPTLEQIWDEFAEKLRGFIQKRVTDPAAAEDILQDVFLKIARRLDQLEDSAKLQGWIYLIARHAVIDYYRARKTTLELPDTLPAPDETEGGEVEELKAAFRRMIERLPEPYREAVSLTELEGMTQQELASHAGITLSGAKSRVQRGRQQLKQMLLDCCHFEFDRRGRVFDCQPRGGVDCPECG